MAIGKYKIVYSDHVGEITDAPEFVTFECDDPLFAVRAYGSAKLNGTPNLVKFKVYPAEDKPLVEGGKATAAKSKSVSIVPKWDNLPTPGSSWIKKVTWRRDIDGDRGTIGVHPNGKDRGIMVYTSDFDTFLAFATWVRAGGSAGEFYNENIKGLPRV